MYDTRELPKPVFIMSTILLLATLHYIELIPSLRDFSWFYPILTLLHQLTVVVFLDGVGGNASCITTGRH